jgi:hypothetical protein
VGGDGGGCAGACVAGGRAGGAGGGGRLYRVDVCMNGVLACRVARTDVVGRSVISASLGE